MLSRLISLFQEKVENRYYGKYRGIVDSNADGKHMGRLLVKVPSIMGDEVIGWAMPCFPYGGGKDRGVYMVPEKDDGVWVEFEAGNLSYPIWSGIWHAKDETPKGIEGDDPVPDLKVLKSKAGHIIQMDDTPGKENITIKDGKNAHVIVLNKDGIKVSDGINSGQEIVLDRSGITVTDKNKSKITMDRAGIKLTDGVNSGQEIILDGSGTRVTDKNRNAITLDGTSGYPAGKGITLNGTERVCIEGLIDWLLTHQHVGNLGAPTPLFPPDMAILQLKSKMPQGKILSDTVKIK